MLNRVHKTEKFMQKALLINLEEAAQLLGIAKKTARNWRSAGKFPVESFRIGARRMVRVADIEEFVKSLGAVEKQGVTTPVPQFANDTTHRRRGRPRKAINSRSKIEGGQANA
jgi:predicted DNA-binding transcriptional regulator AlpA